ncbi:MAG: DMT family transporter [Pseudomonadota bacterium]
MSIQNDHGYRGPLMMAIAVMTIPLSDTIAKWLADSLSVGQIAALRFLFQSLFLLPFFVAFRRGYGFRRAYLMLGGLLGGALLFLFWGLKYLPLANNIALFFIEPLVLVIFSRLFLGERISPRRWAGVVAGLAGALIILRPNWSLYGLAALLPIAAACFYAAYLTATRAWITTRDHREALVLQFWVGLAAMLVMGGFLLAGQPLALSVTALDWPATAQWLLLVCSGALGAFAHVLIVMAFARDDASRLAPLQYLEIFGATLLGWWVFAELPDAPTVAGAALIVAAGIYVIRERRFAEQPIQD